MKRCVVILFVLLAIPCVLQLEALNRDYSQGHSHYSKDLTLDELEEEAVNQTRRYASLLRDIYHWYDYFSSVRCREHSESEKLKCAGLTSNLIKLIPTNVHKCAYGKKRPFYKQCCKNFSIYSGYVDLGFNRYRHHLKRHLEYCQKNRACRCYWPECTHEAALISNLAYLLFGELFSTTALKDLLEDERSLRYFYPNDYRNLDSAWDSVIVSFIGKQLHFVDYYNVCRDIENYARASYGEEGAAEIKEKL